MRKVFFICSSVVILILLFVIAWNVQQQSLDNEVSLINEIAQSTCAKFEYCKSADNGILITSEIKTLSNVFLTLDIISSNIPVSEWIYKITFNCNEISLDNQEIVVLIGDKSMSINGVVYSCPDPILFDNIVDIFASKYNYFANSINTSY